MRKKIDKRREEKNYCTDKRKKRDRISVKTRENSILGLWTDEYIFVSAVE
jgi:hypothetical protein